MAAVWRIPSPHLSRIEAHYLTPHLVEGVAWEAVWATMQQLAQPTAEGVVAMTGEGVGLYGAVCPLPKRLQHLYSCQPVEPAHDPAMQGYIGCRLRWMVHHTMRRRTSIARLGERAAPINLLAGGY